MLAHSGGALLLPLPAELLPERQLPLGAGGVGALAVLELGPEGGVEAEGAVHVLLRVELAAVHCATG